MGRPRLCTGSTTSSVLFNLGGFELTCTHKSELIKQVIGLMVLTHLTGKQSVGVEHAVLKKVGDHMPDKQIVDNNKKMVRIRTILSSQMAEHKCESYKIMK